MYPIYKLPLTIDIWEKGRKTQYLIEVDKPYQEFEFHDIDDPDLALVDSDFILVGEQNHTKTPEEYKFQYAHYGDNVRARIDAIEYFLASPYDSISKTILSDALNDSFWAIREEALMIFEKDTTDFFSFNEENIKSIALSDPNPLVRAAAISVLASKERSNYVEIFKSSLNDSSYSVVGQALYAYLQSGSEDIENVIGQFTQETNFNITSSIADYYIKNQDHANYEWFAQRINIYAGGDLWYFIKLFGMYLITAPEDQVEKGIKELEYIAMEHSQFYNRLSAFQSLELLSDHEGVTEILLQVREKEHDPRLKEYFQQ